MSHLLPMTCGTHAVSVRPHATQLYATRRALPQVKQRTGMIMGATRSREAGPAEVLQFDKLLFSSSSSLLRPLFAGDVALLPECRRRLYVRQAQAQSRVLAWKKGGEVAISIFTLRRLRTGVGSAPVVLRTSPSWPSRHHRSSPNLSPWPSRWLRASACRAASPSCCSGVPSWRPTWPQRGYCSLSLRWGVNVPRERRAACSSDHTVTTLARACENRPSSSAHLLPAS